jgi:feruloyl esterase
LWQYKSGLLDSGGQITLAKLRLARNGAVATCDRADGLADGLINDPERCHWDPRSLLCKAGADQSSCLTAAEVTAIERLESPIKDPRSGAFVFDRMLPGSSDLLWRNMETLNRHVDSYYRLMVTNDSKRSPVDADFFELLRMSEQPNSSSRRINSIDPDLSAFRARGAKLIQYHGWNDQSFAPSFNTRYYSEVIDLQPGADKLARTQDFYRLFMVPGMAHCRGGYGPTNLGGLDHLPLPTLDADHDALEALDRWVEKGVAPERLIATEFVDEKAPQRQVKRQMPLCPYPKVAMYVAGDVNRAESFSCKVPVRHQAAP